MGGNFSLQVSTKVENILNSVHRETKTTREDLNNTVINNVQNMSMNIKNNKGWTINVTNEFKGDIVSIIDSANRIDENYFQSLKAELKSLVDPEITQENEGVLLPAISVSYSVATLKTFIDNDIEEILVTEMKNFMTHTVDNDQTTTIDYIGNTDNDSSDSALIATNHFSIESYMERVTRDIINKGSSLVTGIKKDTNTGQTGDQSNIGLSLTSIIIIVVVVVIGGGLLRYTITQKKKKKRIKIPASQNYLIRDILFWYFTIKDLLPCWKMLGVLSLVSFEIAPFCQKKTYLYSIHVRKLWLCICYNNCDTSLHRICTYRHE
jgi:hypothetical protein